MPITCSWRTSMKNDLEASTFQNKPAYRYIRTSDHVPTENGTLALIKLFNPTGAGTWYIAEYDPETRIAYGLAHIQEAELWSFSMEELVNYRGRFGLPLERDLWWQPCPLNEVEKGNRP